MPGRNTLEAVRRPAAPKAEATVATPVTSGVRTEPVRRTLPGESSLHRPTTVGERTGVSTKDQKAAITITYVNPTTAKVDD